MSLRGLQCSYAVLHTTLTAMQSQIQTRLRPVEVLVQLLQCGHEIFYASGSVCLALQPADQMEIQRGAHVAQRLELLVLQQATRVPLYDDLDEELLGRWVPAMGIGNLYR